MTQDEIKKTHTEPEGSDPAATDLLDRLRHSQFNSEVTPSKETSVDGPELASLPNNNNEDETVEHVHEHESGKLPPEARRALVSLLKYGVILATQKSKLFDSVCRYQSAVQSHLADVYLKLVLDEKTGVAFVAQLDENDVEDEEESVSLITRRTLSLYDTLLLLVLRKHYQERESAGEQRVIIDIERIEANLLPFLPLTNSAKSDRKKLITTLNKMLEKRLLRKVRGSNDRLEITPVIRYVVNAVFLEQMLEEYQGLADEVGLTTNVQGRQKEGTTSVNDQGNMNE